MSFNEANTAVPFPTSATIHQIFEQTAIQVPETLAINVSQQTLSYRELNNKANQLAHFIRQYYRSKFFRELTADTLIGLSLYKCADLFVALLAILKAGAAYVPLDPEYPEERLRFMLEDSAVELIITNNTLCREKLLFSTTKWLCLDEWEQQIGEMSNFNLAEYAAPSNLAYVMYTSGSTGRAKGVMVEHRNVCNLAYWQRDALHLVEGRRVLQFGTICFDVSVFEIFPTLMFGASLYVLNEEQRKSFDDLVTFIKAKQIELAALPPVLLAALPPNQFPSLQTLVTGGEPCTPETVRRWSKGRQFLNAYGPTECTVQVTSSELSASESVRQIGRPIYNTRCYVLDNEFKSVGVGRIGELFIGGASVTRGYLNQPEMTKERFVQNPFAIDGQSNRLYRTGDLVRWLANGNLEFVGRADNQIKIRGFRIEPGEIEAQILELGYEQAAVVATEQKSRKTLVAYVVRDRKQVSSFQDTTALRDVLKQRLPDYMVPITIIELNELPLTANGKIDRKTLSQRQVDYISHNEQYIAPRTKLEKQLATIWAKELSVDLSKIGVEDNFFELGGHSLLVSRMLLATKRQLSGRATLARFMENPTISALANLLSGSDVQKEDNIQARVYADALLSKSIKPLPTPNEFECNPNVVLVTGATGFLGCHIVQQLLLRTHAVIYCLVRANNEVEAMNKLQQSFIKNGMLELINNPRIEVVLGDMEEYSLGLSSDRFNELAALVDAIYHNGAHVNHIYDYQYLYAANVFSTLELLRFAATRKNKALHYVSTLSAASSVDLAGNINEECPTLSPPAFINNGYNLTKWVSERLVWQAKQRGFHANIYRPGNITGHSETGLCQPDKNRILLVVKGCLQLGVAPAWNMEFDIFPVDCLANSIAELSLQPGHVEHVFNLHNPQPLTWLQYLNYLYRLGYCFKIVDPKKWKNQLLDIDEGNALFEVISFYLDDESGDIGDIKKITCDRTKKTLAAVGISYPQKNNKLLHQHFTYLIDSGFLPLPIKGRSRDCEKKFGRTDNSREKGETALSS